MQNHPHRRYNPLLDEWILVSPHRTNRPWQGTVDKNTNLEKHDYDPHCYLCPGNERAGGKINPNYSETFVFTNDFAAILPFTPDNYQIEHNLFKSENIQGTSRVICFSPNHGLTLPLMKLADIKKVVDLWCEQTEELGKLYKWVQIFENKGEIMGCSNPHPHGQIWAGSSIPNEVLKEDINQKKYYSENNSVLLLDYLNQELENNERVVLENDDWIVIIPYWAIWPFETILVPKHQFRSINELRDVERNSLADILKRLLTKYDNLFGVSFPYSMGWHGAPFNDADNNHWQLHAHFYPPLLRSSTVKKFMVGYEMLAEPQRDITAEIAAKKLRKAEEFFNN